MLPFTPKGPIYKDQDHKTALESRNGLIQSRFIVSVIEDWNSSSRLTPDLICKLQELAINNIYSCAGRFRDGPVYINGAIHQPPPASDVIPFVGEMCDYVNQNWGKTAIHLSAYTMWRSNWIHPFFGGNGRTSRALSYLILSARLGFVIPGKVTIPELIASDRKPYFEALRKADLEYQSSGIVDVSRMEEIVDSLLAKQLLSIHNLANDQSSLSPF